MADLVLGILNKTCLYLREFVGWTYEGVDHSFDGNGGVGCRDFIPTTQKIIESLIFITFGIFEMCYSKKHLILPKKLPPTEQQDGTGRRVILMLMTITFGIELGFKFATKQLIWLLNPCHMVTMMQIYLLVAPPTKTTMALFRLHMHCLNGATIAIIFPVVNTRLLPFETEVYYIQHILILVIPYYLMRMGGVYTPERTTSLWWMMFASGFLMVYHYAGLQVLAMVSLVNLNNMMCPAVSDPFYGQWYRVCAVVHQMALVTIHGKIYTFIAQQFLSRRSQSQTSCDNGCTADSDNNSPALERNGHAKIH